MKEKRFICRSILTTVCLGDAKELEQDKSQSRIQKHLVKKPSSPARTHCNRESKAKMQQMILGVDMREGCIQKIIIGASNATLTLSQGEALSTRVKA
ncbi:hypothetical protein PILCRDRAFT_291227 [Piloderma croceum F 1598]|uniref:Uncharacterized protein n=1 Tax=Piloderma croceum (strain F 1598) TaxID=765440 RepID=A0A0C3BKG7_PILCF|nr:hypothetical protein PILCRDRAFT_291227 [Piloderma croceum F 1598]